MTNLYAALRPLLTGSQRVQYVVRARQALVRDRCRLRARAGCRGTRVLPQLDWQPRQCATRNASSLCTNGGSAFSLRVSLSLNWARLLGGVPRVPTYERHHLNIHSLTRLASRLAACRDWFQLTLKEGLTVFRDSCFSADMTSEAVKRIEDVRVMRAHQFVEDAGPMAHPIRPESYIAIDNFYTVTVYEKGCEVIRMYHTLLGAAGFRKGMDLYFERHDGQAVTCDDFRAAMADANGRDFSQFERWYTQAGTPTLKAVGVYDAAKRSYSLELSQSTPATPKQPTKLPFHIPVKMQLLSESGRVILPERVLELTQARQTFVFEAIPSTPVLSLLRGFSAPVKVDMPLSNQTLELLAAHDDDPFNRWDASQQLASRVVLALVAEWQQAPDSESRSQLKLPDAFVSAFRTTLTSKGLEPSLQAYALTLPEYSVLSQELSPIDPDALVGVLRLVRRSLALQLRAQFASVYTSLAPPKGEKFTVAAEAVGRRRLRNVCLEYLSNIGDAESQKLSLVHFREATTMTDSLAALKALDPYPGAAREEVSAAFYSRAKANSEALVINKWFAVQASSFAPDALQRVQALMSHEAYDGTNPNRVRALVSMFANANPAAFHKLDGSGYEFIASQVPGAQPANPLSTCFLTYSRTSLSRASYWSSPAHPLLACSSPSSLPYREPGAGPGQPQPTDSSAFVQRVQRLEEARPGEASSDEGAARAHLRDQGRLQGRLRDCVAEH